MKRGVSDDDQQNIPLDSEGTLWIAYLQLGINQKRVYKEELCMGRLCSEIKHVDKIKCVDIAEFCWWKYTFICDLVYCVFYRW